MNARPVSGGGCLRAGCRRGVGCLVLGIISIVVVLGLDIAEAPWAFSFLGRPSLTGHWAGTFITPSGTHFALYLEVNRGIVAGFGGSDSRFAGDLFDGRGYWCDDHGRSVENSPLSGSVPMFSGYSGSIEPVFMHIEVPKTAPLGLMPVNLKGKWQQETITLTPELLIWTGQGLQSSSANPDQTQPITITMKKAELGTFRSACAQLGRSQ